MKKLFVLCLTCLLIAGCSNNTSSNSKNLQIAVSIQPLVGIIQSIVEDTGAQIISTIPPGNSPANYQPSPKELAKVSDASVYFSIGVPAENNILRKIVDTRTEIVSLLEAVHNEHTLRHLTEHDHAHEDKQNTRDEDDHDTDHDEEGIDPHIWLSPKRVITMVKTIVETLSAIDPDHGSTYKTNGDNYIASLEALDTEIMDRLNQSALEGFIIYHPSLGYFADDYGLTMHVIEEGGKEATITNMTKLVDYAKEHEIKVIFYQEEFDSKQAKLIAKEIGGKAVPLDILSKDYISNMQTILQLLTTQ